MSVIERNKNLRMMNYNHQFLIFFFRKVICGNLTTNVQAMDKFAAVTNKVPMS